MSLRFVRAVGAVALVVIACQPALGLAVTKKLIEFGWDEPDPAFMRQHIAQMEKTPFDGVVYHLSYKKQDGATSNFAWDVWGRQFITREQLEPGIADLKATPFRRFRHNFLRFNTTPADMDWFDDYSAVIHNARLAAWAAREGGSVGVWLDPEQYHSRLFDFDKQRDAGTKGWAAYAAQARKRGYQVMEAFQQGYPNLVVYVSFGYTMPWRGSGRGRLKLEDTMYGLLAPFMDGMVDAARGRTRIIEGHELSYPIREPWEILASYREMRRGALPIVADPKKYLKVISCSFGIWMDYDWSKLGWSETETAKNYRPPGTFEVVVRKALQTTDEYVWIYTEAPKWWTAEGKTEKLPAEYVNALRKARAAVIGPERARSSRPGR